MGDYLSPSDPDLSTVELDTLEDTLAAFKNGEIVIMIDDKNREDEGDLVIATEFVTAEKLAFMMVEARGLICASIDMDTATRLNLPLQTLTNNSAFQTPFAVTVDARAVGSSGVTAAGRARTMQMLIDPLATAEDFVAPGHVFPLIASPLGVLGRRGQTEGSHDLARIAGLKPSAVICEILNPDGTMARGAKLAAFASSHGLRITSVEEVRQYRLLNEILVRELAQSDLETAEGIFKTFVMVDDADRKEHLALVFGDPESLRSGPPPLVRIHSECLTGDVFGSRRCDCGGQLHQAMRRIAQDGRGVILYLRQEGRGIGFANKLRAYALQDQGHDTVEANEQLGFAADLRDFAIAAKILGRFGLSAVRLLTNNPAKVASLEQFGVKIAERIPLVVPADEYSKQYLETKKQKLGHWL